MDKLFTGIILSEKSHYRNQIPDLICLYKYLTEKSILLGILNWLFRPPLQKKKRGMSTGYVHKAIKKVL
ncbi:hypothetical protein [Lelliottia nimipressuralis]